MVLMGDKAPTNDGGQFWKLPHLHHSSIPANLYVQVYNKFPPYSYSLTPLTLTLWVCVHSRYVQEKAVCLPPEVRCADFLSSVL